MRAIASRRAAACCLAIILPALVLGAGWYSEAGFTAANVTATEARAAVLAGTTILVDVREPYEVKAGAPEGSRAGVPYRLDGSRDDLFLAEITKIVGGDRSSDITLICATGVRSAAARDLLAGEGFGNVRSLLGGFVAWRERGLPTDRQKKE